MERSKRIREGQYSYRGFKIICLGHGKGESRLIWECVSVEGKKFGLSFSKRDCMLAIDKAIKEIEEREKNFSYHIVKISTKNKKVGGFTIRDIKEL